MNIYDYHWVWYLLGFCFIPRTTVMILVCIHFSDVFPVWAIVVGWIIAVFGGVQTSNKD